MTPEEIPREDGTPPEGAVPPDSAAPVARPRFPWELWGRALLAATALGLFSTAVFYFARAASGEPLPLRRSVLSFGEWYAWALLLPCVVWLARRFPVTRGRRLGSLLIHVGTGTAVVLLEIGLVTIATTWYNREILDLGFWPFPQAYFRTASFWLPYSLIIYAGIVAVVQFVDTRRRLQAERIAASDLRAATSELRAQLADAQLRALRMQLHPHFLFNSLNTASVFMRDGKREEAVELITLLGDLLRQTLDRLGRPQVRLREELSFIEDYLEIETMRHGDRISVGIEADPDALDARVPTLILQPLVENAMRHGIRDRSDGGRVRIRAARHDGRLELEVRDDGPGFDNPAETAVSRGVGLGNTEERLRRHFGDACVLETRNAPGGGAVVRIVMPVIQEGTVRRPCGSEAEASRSGRGGE